ncbi:MAG TPA: HgcAB-associated protein [Candidatus Saccharimonadales bacterium]|nr:HgcAB-associated protein [Candidatus Saccharimonadales bacterium]
MTQAGEKGRRRSRRSAGAPSGGAALECCRVEAVVGVDERGQMVLPKALRDRAGIRPGDKLAVVTWGAGTQACCICLIPASQLGEVARSILGPVGGARGARQTRRNPT